MRPGFCFIDCKPVLTEYQYCQKIKQLTGVFDRSCEQEFDNPESSGYTTANSSIAAKEKT